MITYRITAKKRTDKTFQTFFYVMAENAKEARNIAKAVFLEKGQYVDYVLAV